MDGDKTVSLLSQVKNFITKRKTKVTMKARTKGRGQIQQREKITTKDPHFLFLMTRFHEIDLESNLSKPRFCGMTLQDEVYYL